MLNYQLPMPVHTIIEAYLNHLNVLGYAESTLKSYRKDLLSFAKIVNNPDEMFSPVTIEIFVNSENALGKPYAPAYRNRRLSCLRSFFKYLAEQELLPDGVNPTTNVRFARLTQTEPSSLSYVEYKKIISTIRKGGKGGLDWLKRRDLTIVAMLYNTGLRLSELVSLNIEQFDKENALLTSIKRKGGIVKDLPINQNVVHVITSWLNFRLKISQIQDNSIGNPLFVSRLNKRLSDRTIEKMVKKYSRKAGIEKKITPHTFRHSHCTEIQRRGVEVQTA